MNLGDFNNLMSFLNLNSQKSQSKVDFQHDAIDIMDFFMKLNYPPGTKIKHQESLIATGKIVEALKYIDEQVIKKSE